MVVVVPMVVAADVGAAVALLGLSDGRVLVLVLADASAHGNTECGRSAVGVRRRLCGQLLDSTHCTYSTTE